MEPCRDGVVPGGLLPLHVAVLPDAELLHLAEEGVGGDGGVRPVLLPQDELYPLSGRSCCTKQDLKSWIFFQVPIGSGVADLYLLDPVQDFLYTVLWVWILTLGSE